MNTVGNNNKHRRVAAVASVCLAFGFALSVAGGVVQAAPSAATAPGLGSADSFTVLANAAVTCTDGTIIGDVGTFLATPTGSVTQTNCPIVGTVHVGDGAATAAYSDFLAAYDELEAVQCDTVLTGTLADVTLSPGVYCFDAAATLTGELTLKGPSNGIWIFKIGTSGTGALTGTDFSVVMEGGGQACNVYWWVAEAATLTDSAFQGTILAGAAITITRGSFAGDAFAQADVTITGTAVTGCEGGQGVQGQHCNQGVGNGTEGCDPGNSNQGIPSRSNDEVGGTPGDPGRKGGNGN